MTRRKTLLLIILLVAAGLRIYALGAKSLWLDEVMSVRRVRGSFGEMVCEVAGHDGHPPFYYITQYAAKIFGRDEAAVRIPSLLAGVALVYVVYLIGRRLGGETTGLAAAGLSAVSAFQVYFSQEARPYALSMLLGALSLWLFLPEGSVAGQRDDPVSTGRRAAQGRKKVSEGGPGGTFFRKPSPEIIRYISWTLIAAAMLYTYYYLVFALVAEGVILALSYRRARSVFSRWLTSRVGAAVLFAPYLPVVLWRAQKAPAVPQQSAWDVLASVPAGFVRMLTGIDLAALGAGAVLSGVVYAAAFAPVIVSLFLLRKNRFALTAMVCYVAVPVVAVVLLPWRLQIFEAKHLAFVLPVLIVLVTYGAGARGRRPLAWAGVGVLVALNLFSLAGYYHPGFQKERWPEACRVIAAGARPGDAVTFNPYYLGYPFAHYYDGQRLILVDDVRAFDLSRSFDRLWLVEEVGSSVAIRDPVVPRVLSSSLIPGQFRDSGEDTPHAILRGHKGTIVVRLYERQ